MKKFVLPTVLLSAGLSCLQASTLLPSSPYAFRKLERSEVVDKEGLFTAYMSGDKAAEVHITNRNPGVMETLTVELTAPEDVKGKWWICIYDAVDGERYGTEFIPAAGHTKRVFALKDFKLRPDSKRGDGRFSGVSERSVLVFYPARGDRGKKIPFQIHQYDGKFNYQAPEWQSRINELDMQWQLIGRNGGKGEVSRNPDGSYRFSKLNAAGYVELRLKLPVELNSGQTYYMRAKFRSAKNPLGTLLLLRIAPDANSEPAYHPSGSKTLAPESLLINTHGTEFADRVYKFKAGSSADYYPSIVLYGNPAAVDLTGITLDTIARNREVPDPPPSLLRFSRSDIDRILAERCEVSAELQRDPASGAVKLLFNGKAATPVMYKTEWQERMWKVADFTAAGVPMVSVRVPTSHGVILGEGKYDWKSFDDRIYSVLAHDPHANLVLFFNLYEPYKGWGEANFDELWMNHEGKRGLGNAVHLKTFANLQQADKLLDKLNWWPSYSSQKWKDDYRQIIRDIMTYALAQPYGKAIVAVMLGGGDDGQFQFRKDDFSLPAQKAFRKFCAEKYGTIAELNRQWKTALKDFDEVMVPVISPTSGEPFVAPGIETAYREFQQHEGWKLRDFFAKAVKDASRKKVLTLAYGQPDSFLANRWELAPSLDMQVTIGSYPYRRTAFPYGYTAPESTYRKYGKMHFQELDIRSWRSNIVDEAFERWCGGELTPEKWSHAHRKLIGVSLAARTAWWYYPLDYQGGRFFDAPEIMADIKAAVEAEKMLSQLPVRQFTPDVCVVLGDANDLYIPALPHAAHGNLNAQMNCLPMQAFMLETSGVPHVKTYLKEVLSDPKLQNFKVYIFAHNAFVSAADRQAIAAKLKNRNRTLIFIHASGFIDENGKAVKNMAELTGFKVNTSGSPERVLSNAAGNHPLMRNVQPFMSFGDLRMAIQHPCEVNIWGAVSQRFYLTDVKPDELLGRYADGKAAAAVRDFGSWRSVTLADTQSLSNTLLNNIAGAAGAYCIGNAGHSIFMNGNFISIHALYDDEYTLALPTGATAAHEYGKGDLTVTDGKVKLQLKCGTTTWLFLK